MPKLTLNINASSLRASSCLLHWYRTIVEGYSEKVFNNKIVFGIAGHEYLKQAYYTGNLILARNKALEIFDQPKITKETKDEYQNDRGLFNYVCFDLWSNYASIDPTFKILLKPDGTPAVEVTFSILLYEDDNIIVNLCGTIDKIGKITGGGYAIGDWKFTSFWETKLFLSNFSMASQLRFYVLALKLMARHFPTSQLGEIGSGNLGAFIDGIFLKPKVSEITYKRSDVFIFKDNEMLGFEQALLRRIKQFSQAIGDGSIVAKEGILMNTCQLKYHPCSFFIPCAANNPAIEQLLLDRDYKKTAYDPLNRDKEL